METSSPAAFEYHLGFWLRFVSNHVSAAFAQKLAARNVSVAEWVALRTLYDGELAPSALAAQLSMTRGAITKLTDRLVRRRLAQRHADAGDGRAQRLALTGAGRALVPQLAALADANDAEFFAFLSVAERKKLEKTLKTLARRHGLSTVPTS